jgi:hypothetical protein
MLHDTVGVDDLLADELSHVRMNSKERLLYQFKVTLQDVKPAVWRRIQTPARYSFWDLHIAIHDALNAIDRRYQPYAYNQKAAPGASPDAAVAATFSPTPYPPAKTAILTRRSGCYLAGDRGACCFPGGFGNRLSMDRRAAHNRIRVQKLELSVERLLARLGRF